MGINQERAHSLQEITESRLIGIADSGANVGHSELGNLLSGYRQLIAAIANDEFSDLALGTVYDSSWTAHAQGGQLALEIAAASGGTTPINYRVEVHGSYSPGSVSRPLRDDSALIVSGADNDNANWESGNDPFIITPEQVGNYTYMYATLEAVDSAVPTVTSTRKRIIVEPFATFLNFGGLTLTVTANTLRVTWTSIPQFYGPEPRNVTEAMLLIWRGAVAGEGDIVLSQTINHNSIANMSRTYASANQAGSYSVSLQFNVETNDRDFPRVVSPLVTYP